MRATFLAAGFGLVVGALSLPAQAQGWPSRVETLTYTQSLPICIKDGNPKDQCTVTYQRCLKTGRWTGSVTGRDYGPRIKR